MVSSRPDRPVSPRTPTSRPDSTTTVLATPHLTRGTLTRWQLPSLQGLLYVPDNQEVRLDILRSTMTIASWTPWHHQDDQEHLASVLLAPNGCLCHQLHPFVFGLQSQQKSSITSPWPHRFLPIGERPWDSI